MTHVLDTNVLVIANGQEVGDPECELAAVELIADILASNARIGVDSAGQVLDEYGRNIDVRKPMKVGAQLLIELYRYSISRPVDITEHADRGFEEFPEDVRLNRFDRSDRKFVAVALVVGEHKLAVATDSDFWDHKVALQDAGVDLRFICRHRFSATDDM